MLFLPVLPFRRGGLPDSPRDDGRRLPPHPGQAVQGGDGVHGGHVLRQGVGGGEVLVAQILLLSLAFGRKKIFPAAVSGKGWLLILETADLCRNSMA